MVILLRELRKSIASQDLEAISDYDISSPLKSQVKELLEVIPFQGKPFQKTPLSDSSFRKT